MQPSKCSKYIGNSDGSPLNNDNPESCHGLEEGEGTKDQIFQNHDPPTGHFSFFKGNGLVSCKVLEGYSDASFGAKKETKEYFNTCLKLKCCSICNL